jgi:heterodisulfide reductase subunit C
MGECRVYGETENSRVQTETMKGSLGISVGGWKNNIIRDLFRALLSNGSVKEPQQRDCFQCGPCR